MLPPDVLAAALAPYNLRPADVEFISFSQNAVYRTLDRTRVLRISTGRYTTRNEIEAEFAWIDLLREYGVRACAGLRSPGGRRCEQVSHGGVDYLVSCIAHAPGRPIAREAIDDNACRALGRIMGAMHAAARDLHDQAATLRRRRWDQSRLLREDVAACASRLEPGFAEHLARLVAALDTLPKSPETHGLIHADTSFVNCTLDADGDVSIYDFDNCEFGYFLHDIATTLYDGLYVTLLNRVPAHELRDRVNRRFDAWLAGYSERGPLRTIRCDDLRRFFILREGVIAVHYHRILDFDRLTDSQRAGIRDMQHAVIRGEHSFDGVWTCG
jgi:Ser/Thr protein kinase RdoA (MazF antagonist)